MTKASWTAPDVERADPPYVADERTMLQTWLDFHRQTLLLKCAGLDAEQLATASAPPSNLTLLGLVRHMSEVERSWFRRRMAAQDISDIYCTEEQPDADFENVADADAAADLATFREECAKADEAVVSHQPRRDLPSPEHDLASVGLRAHDRGVRATQRARRPDPGADRRRNRVTDLRAVDRLTYWRYDSTSPAGRSWTLSGSTPRSRAPSRWRRRSHARSSSTSS